MKYNINDLPNKTSIYEIVDYQEQAKKAIDVLGIKETIVSGILQKETAQTIKVAVNVKTTLILACARSLKEVIYPLDFDLELVLGNDETSDYPLADPLDLTDIIFGNIIAEKPYRVFHESTSEDDFKKEREDNKAFSDLDKLIK